MWRKSCLGLMMKATMVGHVRLQDGILNWITRTSSMRADVMSCLEFSVHPVKHDHRHRHIYDNNIDMVSRRHNILYTSKSIVLTYDICIHVTQQYNMII